MGARAAIKDVGRVLEIGFGDEENFFRIAAAVGRIDRGGVLGVGESELLGRQPQGAGADLGGSFEPRPARDGERWVRAGDDVPTADLIIHHAKVLTVDAKFHIVEAIAVLRSFHDGRLTDIRGDLALIGPIARLSAQIETVIATRPVGARDTYNENPTKILDMLLHL